MWLNLLQDKMITKLHNTLYKSRVVNIPLTLPYSVKADEIRLTTKP